MRKHIRFTALLLAVCILLNNAAFPTAAEGSLDSSQETTVPTEVTTVSTEKTSTPTEETSAPTEETSVPTEETSAPTEETSAPTEPSLPQPIATGTVTCDTSVNIRSGPGTGYEVLDFAYDGQQVSIYEIVTTEEGDWGRIGEGRWICLTYVLLDGQEPTEETTAPTEETTDPTVETTDPTEESTAPTEETSDPTEESTDPTEETTDPLTELHAQLAAISVGIQYAEIVPQKMSLTWWAMNCGKMQVDLSLVAENMLAASPEGVVLSEDAIPQELLYQPENNILFLSSPKDLVYLSYVDPAEYQRMTLRFLPSQQENRGFYLIDPMDELQFSPLGSLEAPFRGKLIFQELTGPIQLDCPLFDALTDEVKIEDLILECRAEEPMEGGLLAKWVVHTYGGAEWDITLSAPEMEEDAVAILPPLVGSLGSECDVALELANSSGLRVIGSGFLCTQMGTNAKFTVSGLSALPSVTGYAGNVGGLVGSMNSGAELTVLGDCLAVSSVTGSTNVGGLIGSAFDPVLSLPMVTGAESALVTGENAGGVIGSLAYPAGDHALSLSAGNLQINGRTNAGGLVGLLSNENGLLELTASAEGISFGSDALGCTGSLIGSYLAPQMVESLVLNGEAVADEASLVDLIGNASPAEEPTDPTEETTDPTEESTDPIEETTDPTEETTDPAAQLAAEIEAILSADVIPQEMSLTWWAICCGKMDIAVSLTSEGEENTDTTALPPELNYTPAEGILQITSAQDLILLSYVDPQAYCNLTLDFIPTEEEATGFDLRSQPDRLEFLSLGSLDAPFAGKVCFAEWAGPVLLEKPLFAALSDDAQLIQVSLECHAKEAIEGGLLAKYVVHNVGGNTWQITLEHPEMEEGATAFLPALLGSVAAQSNVSLELTDRSGLQVLGSGFLCDVLDEAATLNVSGLSLIPTVTGYSENIGGLIGQMNAGSSLLVSGESLTLSQVIGSQNAGGVIGAAEDAILSLPPIVGTEGATIRGQNVGALAGSLTLSAGEHAITQNASNLTLDGSANAGGLFGILCLKDATLSLTTTLDGLSFGESALGNNGSIFGTFQAPTLENALILNGEPVIDRTGFKALAGSTQSEDPIVTVEEVQEMMDEIANAELIPGEMSLAWWAVVCEKVTAEEIAAEINGTSLPSEETEPTQESVPAEEETEPTTATEATMQTEASEETTLPQDSPSGGASDTTEEDILNQEDVLLTEYAPMAASFSLNRSASLRTLSLSEEDEASPLSLEEGAAISTFSLNGENSQDEGTPVLLTQSEDESEEDTPAGGIALLGDDVVIPIVDVKIPITNAEDLIRLSYVLPSEYQNKEITISNNDASTSTIINVTDPLSVTTTSGNTATLEFRGLGDADNPYEGTLNSTIFVKLKRPLFNALSDSATVTAKLYVDPDVTGSGILAKEVFTGTSEKSSPWTVELGAVTENTTGTDFAYSLPLLGTMKAGSSVNVNMTLSVGSLDGNNQFTAKDNYSALTILGGGCLCGTMETGTAKSQTTLTVTGLTGIPAVNNTSGDAGSLVGTMGSNTQVTVTLPEGTTALPISNVTASENAGGLVGSMSASASLSIGEGNKISTTGVTITGNNAGGLVGWMEGATTLTADWSSFIVPTVKGTEYAGGLAGYAKDPDTTFQNIPATGPATISGKKAGGLVGWLDNTQISSFTLNATVQNLTISGSESSGGLFGELHNDHGSNAAPISYTISKGENLTAGNEFSNVILTGGNAGGLIGKYFTDDLKNTLKFENISVTSSSSATNYGGVIGNVDSGVAAYVEFSMVTSTSSEPSSTYFGGLIGLLSDTGHMVKVGENVTINATSSGYGSSGTGGLIGYMPNGVLFITGSSSPVLNYGTITNKNANTRGWILGKRGNTLVYTDIPGWNAEKGSETNDTGVWGQVLRVDQLTNLIAVNPDHTVTVKAHASAYSGNEEGIQVATVTNTATISNKFDFAAVALRLQLNPNGALTFDGGDFDKASEVTITFSELITDAIDLNNTGLTGLTRDVNSTDIFKLTINGNSKTITLPDLKVFASGNAHDRQGLIGKAGELTVNGLTVNGDIKTHVLNGDIYSGALLAEATGATTLKSITSSIQMTIDGTSDKDNCAYSGIVAATKSDCTSITFDGCKLVSSSITDNTPKKSYVAGFLSLGNYNNGNVQTSITVQNNCSVSGNITKAGTPSDYARIGGLIATLYNGSYALEISNLTVSGLTVSAPTDFDKTCGGLLGYEWINTRATISGVTITDCTLNAQKCMFGGLVYKGSGYWKVGNGTDETIGNGISIPSSTFNGYSKTDRPSGLLVCRANVEDIGKGALYLEILYNGYSIGADVNVKLIDNGTIFDELVGTTKGDNGNGIVSIATAAESTEDTPAKIDQKDSETGSYSCNTYRQQLSGTQYNNPYTRYYYNLNLFRGNTGTDGKVTSDFGAADSAGKMVLWSAWDYCDSTLNEYFMKGRQPSTISGILNLSGYSYYPVSITSNVTIADGTTITFDYEGLETAEATNKKPSLETQHKGMHTGLFTDVTNNAETGELKLTATNLTLTGTVGKSAIINGLANGKNQSAKTLITLTGVNLNGIKIYPAATEATESSALLIQNIGDFSTLKMSGVKTRVAAEGEALDYPKGTYAASSLIGKAGNDSGKHIQLEFSDMVLDGRENSDNAMKSGVYGTYHSIFTHALFLMQFEYSDGNTCRGVYNFEKGNNHQYTLGRELSNTDDPEENSGRNNNDQFWFFRGGDNDYVCYAEQANSNPKTYFASGYRRYVNYKEDQTNTSHELDINLRKPTITSGCGTYSDPYIIDSYRQLIVLAELLNSDDGTVEGMQVTLNVGDNGVIKTDKSFGPQNAHTADSVTRIPTEESTEEAGGTSGGESEVTSAASENTSATYGDCTDVVFTCENGTWTSDHTTVNSLDGAIVHTYLRNAYYKIRGTINLPSTWTGLGELSPEKAFSGVIVGEENSQIHLNPNNAKFTQFGGLIKYSLGSVVKNVNITYDSSINVLCDKAPNGTDASFFGGVVGWCMGGDTIIDNVDIQFADKKKISTTGSTQYLASIGGYVGLVGGTEGLSTTSDGLGGGVVFRNISSSFLTGTICDKVSNNGYFYCNPYVGRVLDGYALSEGGKLENTDKNYQIPGIRISSQLVMTDSQVTVNDDEGLWLLSAIANSGAGNAANCAAYTVGKARTCKYDKVGLASEASDRSDEHGVSDVYLGGDASKSKTTSYLTNGLPRFSTLTDGNAVSIVLASDCNMTDYGNGFRGIGTSYGLQNAANPRLIRISSLDGKNKTIILAQDRKEYSGEREKWSSIGSGLFILLAAPSENNQIEIKNLTFTGKTGISYYENSTKAQGENAFNSETGRVRYVGAGALAANLASETGTTITINNVSLNGLTVNFDGAAGSTYAGGLIGAASYSGSSVLSKVELINCKYNGLTVRGRSDVGGFLGYVCADNVTITYTSEATLNNATVVSTATPSIGYYYNGTGGLIGQTEKAQVSIIGKEKGENDTAMPVKFTGLSVESKYNNSGSADKAQIGGLIGLLSAPEAGHVTIRHLSMEGAISVTGGASGGSNTSAGGLVGALVRMKYTNENRDWDWNSGGSVTVTISDIWIAQEAGSSMSVSNFRQGGGLIGILAADKSVTISNVKMGSTNGPVTIHNAFNKIAHCEGGFVGAVIKPKMYIKDSQLTNTTIKAQYDTDRGSALLVGYSEKAGTIDIRNMAMENCQVMVGQTDFQSALLYGLLKDNAQAITGTNILARNCKMGYTSDWSTIDPSQCTKMGIWGGSVSDTINHTVYLVGMSLWNNITPAQDFGGDTPKSYVIRADYLADTLGTTSSSYPHVVTSPVKAFTGIGPLTGDGIGFAKNSEGTETTTPIAQGIVQDYLDGKSDCLIHFNAKTSMDYFCSTTDGSKAVNTSYFSTFNTAGENSFANNFPVLVINSTETKRADSIVKNYISLLTNADSSLPTSIQATAYKWDAENSVFVTNNDPSLTVANKTITVGTDKYDNQKGQFTLLDVQYADPADNTKTAYHLYIPVIVKKVLEFKFWAAAENGTTYSTGVYGELVRAAIGANTDKITALLTFEYERSAEEWQAAVNNGENLLWNFDKKVVLSALDEKSLPKDTRLTLVDRNDGDKAYYLEYRGGDIQFSDFAPVSGGQNWSWDNVCLCDLLKLTPNSVKSSDNASNKYVKLDTGVTAGATLRIETDSGTDYYRPADTETENLYSITVSLKDEYSQNGYVQETYYLTMQKPNDYEDVSNFYIMGPPTLDIPIKDGKPVAVLPTTRLKAGNSQNHCAVRGAENQVFIGDLFTQEITVAAEENTVEQMSVEHNSITATVTSTIHFKDEYTLGKFNEFSSTRTIYQSIRIYLKEIVGENATAVTFADGTTISINGDDIPLNSSKFDYVLSNPITTTDSKIWKLEKGKPTYTYSFTFTLTYSDDGILNQFPVQNSAKNNGIRIFAESALSLNETALDRSNLRVQGNDSNLFYREDVSLAKLYYNVDYSKVDYSLSPNNAPGINGRAESSISIPTVAVYDCSEVAGASSAEKLKLSATLYCKDSDGKYTDPIADYSGYLSISDISFKILGDGTITKDEGTFSSFTLSNFDGQSRIQICFNLNVKSSAAFETGEHTYANYKLVLKAELEAEQGNGSYQIIEGSTASDFIIYTNAKIRTDLIS